MEKIVKIDGHGVRMVANARVPRIYRNMFGRDLIVDMQRLQKSANESAKTGESLPVEALTIFEDVAWVFLKEGGEDVGQNPDEWLEHLDGVFSVYEALPEILELWRFNNAITSRPSK